MIPVSEKKHIIAAEDNFPVTATVFSPPSGEKGNTAVIIASGMGVPRYTYYKFARYLAGRQYPAVTFDYRGIYESEHPGFSPEKMKMEEFGSKDLEAVIHFAREELGTEKLILIAHSMGGQIMGLAPSSVHIDAAVFLSVTLGHWRYWPGLWKWGLFLFWHVIPLLSWRRKYFPAKLIGLSSINIPSGVARQWARWGRSENYLFDFIDEKSRRRYKDLDIPVLALSFSDDKRLGPKRAADKILEYYQNAEISRQHIRPGDYHMNRIGHFGFFKDKFKASLWQEVFEWIEKNK